MFKTISFSLFVLLIMSGTAAAQQCPTFPYTLTNGSLADATQVMADLNTLRNCAAPISNPQFANSAEITSSGQPSFLMSETSGTAGHRLGGIVYDGGAAVAGGGWVFQKMSDAGGFAANLVTVLQNAPAIGIGTLVPLSALDVNGGVAIGSYAGANSAPTNGLIVSGNVGIGTTSPSHVLDVFQNQNGLSNIAITNQTSGSVASANVVATNDTSNFVEMGIYSSGSTPAGSIAAGDSYIYTSATLDLGSGAAGGVIKFLTGGISERVRIDSLGNVGIGTTSPSYLLQVNGTAYAAGAAGALSDIRHKKDVASLKDGALDNVMKLRPVSFQWKALKDEGMKGRQMGFIAQEVEKVLPSAVLTQHDANRTKGLKYNEIVAVLTKAIQEQQVQFRRVTENQQAEIESLKSEVMALKTAKLASLK